jgi:dipeptidyl aminopeptidase/acylaminoacyl peptidase
MQQRPRRPPPSSGIRRLLLAGVAVALAALLLARWQPWRDGGGETPRPVALVPTATPPLPTPTRAPERVSLPSAAATGAATPPATMTPAASAGRRATGAILATGELAGRAGIVASAADGSEQRLIAAGQYDTVAWSPDGAHFAAAGPLPGGGAQVALFDAGGRTLARHAVEGRVGSALSWSPGGGEVAWVVVAAGSAAPGLAPPSDVWRAEIGGAARRVAVPDGGWVSPLAWSPDGTLFVASYAPANGRYAIWRVGPGAGLPVPVLADTIAPLALSDNGRTLLALGPTIEPAPTELIAINLRTGERRTLADAGRVGAVAFGSPATPGTDRFSVALLAPGEAHMAVVVERPPQEGATLLRPERELVILARDGTVTGVARVASGGLTWPMAWSPDGTLLAFNADGNPADESALYVVDTRGERRASARFARSGQSGLPSFGWSPDGRWLAYADSGGVTMLAADGGASYTLALVAGRVAWRP